MRFCKINTTRFCEPYQYVED